MALMYSPMIDCEILPVTPRSGRHLVLSMLSNAPSVADLSQNFRTYHFSFEVSVRGQVCCDNKKRLKAFVYRVCDEPKAVSKSIITLSSKAALLASFSIFTARNEPSWISPSPLIIK